jgi:carbon-monoxide dehydrogenase small subunit
VTKRLVTLTINGEEVGAAVEPRMTLADFIRSEAELTGTHVGCEHGVCGACTVRLDGRTVRSCLLFAVQCEGSRIETIEGLADGPGSDLQQAFVEHNALQCGFCTSGMLITADELLGDNPMPTREQVREHLSGNYCRCTGYQAVVDAIMDVADRRRRA